MNEYLGEQSVRYEINDESTEGALFEIVTNSDEARKRIFVPLGRAAEVESKYQDSRMARAHDDTSAPNK